MTTTHGQADEIDQLYAAYAEFMNDSRRALLEGEPDESWRIIVCRLTTPKSKEDFKNRLACLPDAERADYRAKIMRGWLSDADYSKSR